MGTAFAFVWGMALLVIAALGAALVVTLRQSPPPPLPGEREPEFEPVSDTLLFYYEENCVRSAVQDTLIIRIPGAAWDAEWVEDLLRLEVSTRDPASIALPDEGAGFQAEQIVAAYDLSAYRMTEIGTDIEVERFPAPIELVFPAGETDPGVRLLTWTENAWELAPATELSLDEFQGSDVTPKSNWLAVSVTGLGAMCLIRGPGQGEPSE
jgi:hypothetical protein